MTDYAWFPVTGDGETEATAYTWNVGTFSFDTGSYWADVDANPPYPVVTGTVPGAVVAGIAQDSVYIFAGQGNGSDVNEFYQPDPSKGDPYIAEGPDGNYDFSTNILFNSGSLALNTLGLEEVNFGAGTFVPTLDVSGATLDVQGPLLATYSASEFPAGLSGIVSTASEYAGLLGITFPQPGGVIELAGGGTLEVGGTISPAVDIAFQTGSGNTFRIDSASALAATAAGGTLTIGGAISNFATGDTIDLPNVTDALVQSVSYTDAGQVEIALTGGDDIFLNLSGAGASHITPMADPSLGLELVACYAMGTRIATPDGEIPVEALRTGDAVVTASGGVRPVRWIGHRSYAGRFVARNSHVMPVLIRQGALADNIPRRDLYVSPNHAMYLEGMLIPAGLLVNGTSIVQLDTAERIDYFHVELETHDVILAEGAPAETFVDDDSRAMFHNAGEYAALYPGAGTIAAHYYAQRVEDGEELEAVRGRLARRGRSLLRSGNRRAA